MSKKKYFTPEEVDAAKRESARKWRSANIEVARERVRKNHERRRAQRIADGETIRPRIRYKTDEERRVARKAVLRKYYLSHKEQEIERSHAWAKNNRKRCAANLLAWRIRNRKRYEAWKKSYYAKNLGRYQSEEFKKARKDWRMNNPDLLKKWGRISLKRNRPRIYAKLAKRRAAKKSLLHAEADAGKIKELYRESIRLSKNTGVSHSVDHVIALASGGFEHHDNLQVMTRKINSEKGANPFWLAPHMGIKDWRDVPRHLWPEKLAPKYLELIEANRGKSIRWDTAA